jgi:hypothetical protein
VLDSKEAVISFDREKAWAGQKDLSARYWFGWHEEGLYVYLEVADDLFSQEYPLSNAWRGDSVQLYLDLMADGRDYPGQGFDENDMTIWAARIDGQDLLYRRVAPAWQVSFVDPGILSKGGNCVITRDEGAGVTSYEIHLPPDEIFPLAMKAGTLFGFAALINDADGDKTRKQGLSNTTSSTEPYMRPELWPQAILLE